LADLLAAGLSDQGLAADVAYDGTEAASKLGVNRYDVVVLDRTLPGIPGDTLCQMISGSDERCMVLMLSGAASPADRTSGLGLGADDYLVKPFHFPELVLRVRALARRRPRAQPRALRAAGSTSRSSAEARSSRSSTPSAPAKAQTSRLCCGATGATLASPKTSPRCASS
jgi:DNA-binding response OmpR family regulator